jgi:hypothetical protein
MIGWAIRILLVAAGTIAAIFVARDAENFGVVQGMIAVALVAAVVLAAALLRRK